MCNISKIIAMSLVAIFSLYKCAFAEIGDTDLRNLKTKIQKEIAIPELQLTAEEQASVVRTVESFCINSPLIYSENDIQKITYNVLNFMKHRGEWNRFKSDMSLRELINKRDFVVLEGNLVTYEILRDVHGDEAAGNASNEYLMIVSKVVDRYFNDIPIETRRKFIADIESEYSSKASSLFTFSGKEKLTIEETERIEKSLTKSAEDISREMKANVQRVPKRFQESIANGYLDRLRPALSKQFQTSTSSKVKSINVSDEKVRDRLLQREHHHFDELRIAEANLLNAYKIREKESQDEHDADIKKYVAEQQILSKINMPSIDEYLSDRVLSSEVDPEKVPLAEEQKNNKNLNVKIPTSDSYGQASTKDTSGTIRTGAYWIASVSLPLLACISFLYIKKRPQCLWNRLLCITAASSIISSTLNFGSLCYSAERGEQVDASSLMVSGDQFSSWQELSRIRSINAVDMPILERSFYMRINDSVIKQVKILEDGNLSLWNRQIMLSATYDITDYCKRIPIDDDAEAKAEADIVEFYMLLYGDMKESQISPIVWRKSVAEIVNTFLKSDFGPLHVATWSPEIKADLQRWWKGICMLRMPKIEAGVIYGRKISSSPWIHDDKALSDSYVRQLCMNHKFLSERIVISRQTQELIQKHRSGQTE